MVARFRSIRIVAALGCLGLSGCLTAQIQCPTSGPPIMATANSPDITLIAGQVIGLLAKSGVIAAKAPNQQATSTSQYAGSVTLRTVPLFGTQSVSCGPQSPTATN
jgi:hypothetical protein